MAVGNVTNIGLSGLTSSNSTSMLNDELITKLKAADEAAQVNPITKKIEKNKVQREDLAALRTLISNVNVSAKSLTNEALYLRRTTNLTGNSASVTAADGVNIQNFTLDVTQLAQKDTFQSAKFKSATSLVGATSDGSFDMTINGNTYQISVKQSSTYQDIIDQINEKSGGQLEARIINVGGSTNPYQIVLQSKNTGEKNAISIANDTSGVLDKLGWDSANLENNRLLKAQDAVFTYNGVSATRDKNSFNDLRPGVDVTLKELGKTTVDISQDTSGIVDGLKEFIKDYNLMSANLSKAVAYDADSKESGSFQGHSEISSIRSTFARLISSQDSNGRNLTQFGITVGEDGQLGLNESVLNKMLAENANNVKDFFAGTTTQQQISYSDKNVSSGELDVQDGDLSINGVSVKFKTSASSTAAQNALALMNAINNAGISGLTASVDSSGEKIVLRRSDGSNIEISGKDSVLSKLGMSAATVNANATTTTGIFSSIVSRMATYLDKDDGVITTLTQSLKNASENLDKEKTTVQTRLDERYNQMKERFIQYDTIIAKLNNQFSTLKRMIDTELKRD